MTPAKQHRRPAAAILLAAATLAAWPAPPAARAASGTWTGAAGDGLWQSPANWTSLPGLANGTFTSSDVATFTGSPSSTAVAVDPNRNVSGLTFDNTSAPFTIGDNAGNPLHLSPAGTTLVTPSVTNTGDTTLSQTLAAPVRLDGTSYTLTNNATDGTVGLVLSGTVTPNSPSPTTLTLNGSNNAGASTGTAQITGALADGAGAAKLSVVKDGTGNWELRGANTYSGDTVVNAGLLRFVNLGSASPNTHLVINNGGKIRFSTSGIVAPAIEIRSGGLLDTSNSSTAYSIAANAGPALHLNYASAATTTFYTATAPLSLTGTTPGQGGIKLSATPTQTPVNLGSTTTHLDLGPVIRPFEIAPGDPANTATATGFDLRVRGPISGAGGIRKIGAGALRLDNASLTFTGPIEVLEGELRINTSDSLSGSNSLLIGGGTFRLSGSGQTFHLSGVTLTKGSITSTNSASTIIAPSFAFNVAAGDTATSDVALADSSAGAAALTKAGPGTAVLTAANTYTGATTVNAGTLVVSGDARSPFLSSAGGLDLRGGRLVIDYTGGTSSAGTVASLLAASYAASPHFAAGQIRSSTADATHALGYRDDGVSLLTVLYTFYGDLNLDGRVNADDYALLDRGYAKGLTGWSNGDLNYDGAVTPADFLLMDTTFATTGVTHEAFDALVAQRASQFGDAYVAALLTSVPEPASLLTACGLLAVPFVRRRRRST